MTFKRWRDFAASCFSDTVFLKKPIDVVTPFCVQCEEGRAGTSSSRELNG
jgi:hypothetical protein